MTITSLLHILWNLYYKDSGASRHAPGVALVPKLTRQHLSLTSYSKMNVRLAAQVFKVSYYMLYLMHFV